MQASPTPSQPQSIRAADVLSLGWPILVSMLSYTLMGLVDTLFVGRLGSAQLAAIGIAIPVVFLAQAFGIGLLQGVRVHIAQSAGAQDELRARRFAWQGLWIALLLGLVLAALATADARLFERLGATESVAGFAATYFGIRILGAPFALCMHAFRAFFEGRGDTRTTMVANVGANGLNILLDPLLIFGLGPFPALGIGGAALATVLSFVAADIFLVVRAYPKLREARATPSLTLLRDVTRTGAPLGVRGALDVGAWVLFVGLLARFSDTHLAAHVLVVRIVSVSFLPGFALSEAVSVLAGQSLGAGRPEGAREAWRAGLRLAIGFMGGAALLFVAAPQVFVAPFGVSEDVAGLARDLLLIGALFQLVDAAAMVSQGALTGAGDTRFVMVTSVLCSWFVNLPLAWFLALHLRLGAPGAWLGLTLEIGLLAVLSVVRIQGSRWLETGRGQHTAQASSAPEPADAA
ncbi:MAG TPA: hypothetical protein DIU15_11110 [Deltaproteobacteria bacterium]|nr:hypothetical protein [Deltaproteobacteria bacterium]HCP46586.1 hypothetical protein [Deltaproteobacteria bacterium]